jgi:hypothetical protein
MTRVVATLLVASAGWALWTPSVAAKGFPLGRDIRVTCEAGTHPEAARKGSSRFSTPGSRQRARPIVVGCAPLPHGAGTVQLTAAPRAPFRGCVLDSYTVGRREGGILCADFSRAFTAERRAVGLWITRLTPDGPSVALGAAAAGVRDLYLWYTHRSGLPRVTPLARIPVGQGLARQLGAPARLSYLAGALPPDTDLCQETLVGGGGASGAFGPAAFLDTSIITRTEGDGNLTETAGASQCRRLLRTDDSLSALTRMLSFPVAGLAWALAA